ncbi:pantothenate kinase [Pseudomonas sp. dw_358]|uniref:pantothenate kinase n=1 Tax=Pseudomonas sp. dw_358 TaxID=2720083 RepID=UPI001BD51088|nr:pantothenate kinase [Pseudomonas sp. dw_358]
MILELDCGNSFIKWRVILSEGGGIFAGGTVDSDLVLLEALSRLSGLALRHCRLVSVRSEEETTRVIELLAGRYSVMPVCATPSVTLAGVRNGYLDYGRLGLDRWLALVGGYQLAQGNCVVIDSGTAVTSDLVSASGEHMGGYICPGLSLMRNQLRTHTRKIRYDDQAAERALMSYAPGRSTAEAVERGCALMLQGFALTQLKLAQEYWGDDFVVFLAGGDAERVHEVIPQARVVPDLVFVGLAIACPLS